MKSAAQMKARDYYLSGEKTQKEIAESLGISDKTLYLWIKQNAWDQIKRSAYEAPALIVDNMFSQLAELQNSIASREPGQRYPTGQEAEITRKLITCMLKLKDYPSKGTFIQMMNSFTDYTRNIDPQFTREAKNHAEKFFHRQSKAGYKPYQVEYNTDYKAYEQQLEEEEISIPQPEISGNNLEIKVPQLPEILVDKIEEQVIAPVTKAVIPETQQEIIDSEESLLQQQVETSNNLVYAATDADSPYIQPEISGKENAETQCGDPTLRYPYYVSPHGRATPQYMWQIFPDYPRP